MEEEKRPDLTNLKLGQLTIGEKKDNQNRNDGNDYGENDGNYQADGDSDHPWNKGSGSTPAPAQTKTAEPVKNTGAYVPPSLARAEVSRRTKAIRLRVHNTIVCSVLGRPEKPIKSQECSGS